MSRRGARCGADAVAVAAVVVVVAAVVAAAPAAAQRERGGGSGVGRVKYVTAKVAFLDQGADDGLAIGQKIDLTRKAKRIGSCAISATSSHHAVCTFDDAEPGDRFTFVRAVEKRPPPPTARAPLPAAAELEQKRARVESVPLPKVRVARVRAASGARWGVRGEALLKYQAYAQLNGAPDAQYHRPALDAGLRADIGWVRGLSLGTALRLTGDVVQPASARFRNEEPLELTVFELGTFYDVPHEALIAAAGRFRPRRVPGAPLVDGALVGGRALDGSLEFGAYAGLVPDAITLAPRADRFAGGVYVAIDQPFGDVVLLPRARVGFMSASDLSRSRGEADLQAQIAWGRVAIAGGGVRFGIDSETLAGSLDSAHVMLEQRPTDDLKLRASYRLTSPSELDFDVTDVPPLVPPVEASQHADVEARWEATDSLTVSAVGGAGFLGAALRGWVGPEVELRGVLLGGDLGVAYVEELGNFSGRSAYVQSAHHVFDARIVSRISYFETAAFGDAMREAGAMLVFDYPVFPWLRAQGRAQAVYLLPAFDAHARATPVALNANAGLASSF